MSTSGDFGNPLRKFKLVFLGEQSGKIHCFNNLLELNATHDIECSMLCLV